MRVNADLFFTFTSVRFWMQDFFHLCSSEIKKVKQEEKFKKPNMTHVWMFVKLIKLVQHITHKAVSSQLFKDVHLRPVLVESENSSLSCCWKDNYSSLLNVMIKIWSSKEHLFVLFLSILRSPAVSFCLKFLLCHGQMGIV